MSNWSRVVLFLLRFSQAKSSWLICFGVVITGVISGLSNTGLIALINSILAAQGHLAPEWVAGFIALCFLLPLTRFASTALLVRLTEKTVYEVRMGLCRRILSAPQRQLEQLGAHRLMATLTDDVQAVSEALATLPVLCMHVSIVAGCLAYLGWLSWSALLVVLGFMAVGILTYQLFLNRALGYLRVTRAAWDRLVKNMQALTLGGKELKLSRPRREAFLHRNLEAVAQELRDSNVRGHTIAVAGHSWGQVLFFIAIGLLLIVLPRFTAIHGLVLTGYTLVLLYMSTPLEIILNSLPTLNRALAAAEAIESLGLSLAQVPGEKDADGTDGEPWRRLDFVGVTHSYASPTPEESFAVGPLHLTFEPGQIVFVVGGNGSGKTSFAKLLVGLYAPEQGEVCLDGRTVGDASRDTYRQHFSAVFTDFFLFEDLIGPAVSQLDDRARKYLAQLQLDHKVRVRDGALSTIDLSQGQRKRLALLNAYLEDRPIYVFDEWAADQDPAFREIFYRHLLPDLKARGKTIFVISHDDRYFAVADRIVKLELGRVVYDGSADGPPALDLTAGSLLYATET